MRGARRIRRLLSQLAYHLLPAARHLTASALGEPAHLRQVSGQHWQALTDDPGFWLTRSWAPIRLARGWYRVQLCMHVPHRREDSVHGNARFYADAGAGVTETAGMGLPFRSGVVAQRLLHISRPSWLRFDPLEYASHFALEHFSLERVTEEDADRVLRGQSFAEYNDGFERPIEETLSYGRWLVEVEPAWLSQLGASRAMHDEPGLCTVIVAAAERPQGGADAHAEYWENQRQAGWGVHFVEAEQDPDAKKASLAAIATRWVLFVRASDRLQPKALEVFSCATTMWPDADIIYGDHDYLDVNGLRCAPHFKPDWSVDLFYGVQYLGPAVWLRREPLLALADWQTTDEAICRLLTAFPHQVPQHVPAVLLHRGLEDGAELVADWTPHPPQSAGALLAMAVARGEAGARLEKEAGSVSRISWSLPDPAALLSVVVPTRDGYPHLKRNIESLQRWVPAAAMEIIIVNNGSRCRDTLAYLAELNGKPGPDGRPQVRVIDYDQPFNFSAMNNLAVASARGDYLGFLNDDVEALDGGWYEEVLCQLARPAIGCVGGLLTYPDGRVQHAGVVLGLGGIAGPRT
jgi:O-antigen biosynthesis protein